MSRASIYVKQNKNIVRLSFFMYITKRKMFLEYFRMNKHLSIFERVQTSTYALVRFTCAHLFQITRKKSCNSIILTLFGERVDFVFVVYIIMTGHEGKKKKFWHRNNTIARELSLHKVRSIMNIS